MKPKVILKYEQLQLNFNEYFSISTYNSKSKIDEIEKIYLPNDFAKNAFFLLKNSEEVIRSRTGYKAYKLYIKLKKKGQLTEEQIKNQTKYETSPGDTIRNFLDIEESDTVKVFSDWAIIAHQHWGLPDTIDGEVWDVIVCIISEKYKEKGIFYQIYYTTIEDILDELIKRGVYKNKGGNQRAAVKDSLYRLANTIYQHKKGFLRKDINKLYDSKEYQFSLISNLYMQGDKLPNGDISTKIGIAIDPLMLINLRANQFIIANNKQRYGLSSLNAKNLFDKFSYIAHINYSNGNFHRFKTLKLHPHFIINYHSLCEFLGFKPRFERNLKPSQIKKQLSFIHDDLIKQNVILNFYIFDSVNPAQPFNIVYIFNEIFLNNVLENYSKETLKDFQELADPTKEDMEAIFKKINAVIKDADIRNKLIYT